MDDHDEQELRSQRVAQTHGQCQRRVDTRPVRGGDQVARDGTARGAAACGGWTASSATMRTQQFVSRNLQRHRLAQDLDDGFRGRLFDRCYGQGFPPIDPSARNGRASIDAAFDRRYFGALERPAP